MITDQIHVSFNLGERFLRIHEAIPAEAPDGYYNDHLMRSFIQKHVKAGDGDEWILIEVLPADELVTTVPVLTYDGPRPAVVVAFDCNYPFVIDCLRGIRLLRTHEDMDRPIYLGEDNLTEWEGASLRYYDFKSHPRYRIQEIINEHLTLTTYRHLDPAMQAEIKNQFSHQTISDHTRVILVDNPKKEIWPDLFYDERDPCLVVCKKRDKHWGLIDLVIRGTNMTLCHDYFYIPPGRSLLVEPISDPGEGDDSTSVDLTPWKEEEEEAIPSVLTGTGCQSIPLHRIRQEVLDKLRVRFEGLPVRKNMKLIKAWAQKEDLFQVTHSYREKKAAILWAATPIFADVRGKYQRLEEGFYYIVAIGVKGWLLKRIISPLSKQMAGRKQKFQLKPIAAVTGVLILIGLAAGLLAALL